MSSTNYYENKERKVHSTGKETIHDYLIIFQ
jgi:hypothetical protein